MNILIFGRGAIGTQYGWALERAGHRVEFYVRPGRAQAYGDQVHLELWDTRRPRAEQRVTEDWPVVLRDQLDPNHPYDLILLSVNPEQVAGAVAFLAPRVGRATVLFSCNVWQQARAIIAPIPAEQVVFSLGGGGGFEGNTLHAGLPKTVQLGTFGPQLTEREGAVRRLFVEAGFRVAVHRDAQSWLWNHYAMNVAMEIEVLKLGSFEAVANSRASLAGVGRNLRDLVQVLRAKKTSLDPLVVLLARLPSWAVGLLMSAVMAPSGMAYALLKHNHYRVGFAVGELLAEARRYHLDTPRLYEVEALIASAPGATG